MNPKVSIVVLTSNRPIDLVMARIISSIKRQDYANIELVITGNNCPHFESLEKEVKNTLKSIKVTTLNLHPNQNKFLWETVAECRNEGIRVASGEFISAQDDDNELEPSFISDLVNCIIKDEADAAWCHRRILLENGTAFQGDFFPWIPRQSNRHDFLHKIWLKAGIIKLGSDIVRDQLIAQNNSEVFSTVDANEWLVKKHVYSLLPFRESYGFKYTYGYLCPDDLWNVDLRNSALPVSCVSKPNLIYHLGGTTSMHN